MIAGLEGAWEQRAHRIFAWLHEVPELIQVCGEAWQHEPGLGKRVTYLRRGPLLLVGEKILEAVYQIEPPGGVLEVALAGGRVVPRVLEGGRLVNVTRQEGAWLERLRDEVERLEQAVLGARRPAIAVQSRGQAANARALAEARARDRAAAAAEVARRWPRTPPRRSA